MGKNIMKDINIKQNKKILQRPFYSRSTILVAIDLLGKILLHNTPEGILTGRIVEVEAYLGEIDPACHAFIGKTQRTKIFWGKPGITYIFLNYGKHYCLNVITEGLNIPGCVLIRALEPINGIEMMKKNRSTNDIFSLTNGPGKLTQALGISLKQNGVDFTNGDLQILDNENYIEVLVTSRIGISKAKKEPLRFCTYENPFVSQQNRKVSTYYRGTSEMVKKAFYNKTLEVTFALQSKRKKRQVYIGGPLRNKNYRNLAKYMCIAQIVQKLGFKPYLPHIETSEPDIDVEERLVYEKNIKALKNSSLAIFEVTNPSHGVGMEIQFSLSNKIPFLCLKKKGATISKMIRGNMELNQLIQYSNLEELNIKLKNTLKENLVENI